MSPLNECLYSVFVWEIKCTVVSTLVHKYFHSVCLFFKGRGKISILNGAKNLFKYEVHKPCSNSPLKQRMLTFAYFGGFKFNEKH
jgi:hypothetical protein